MALNDRQLLEELKPKIQSWLKNNVTQKRYKHISNVAKTAKKYAKKLRLSQSKAELSGWLHDCAKEHTNKELLKIAKSRGIFLDEIDLDNPHLLHARVGEIIAKEIFKIHDPDVLAGIRCHTLGEPNMSTIAMVVYLADSTEPGREKKQAALIRKTFKEKGLESAMLHAINNKLLEILSRNKKIHPLTIKARNWLIKRILSN